MSDLETRGARRSDAEGMAALLEAAWRETYADLLPMSTLQARDFDRDVRDLHELMASPLPFGATVALRDGSVVGLSTYGPPNHSDEPGLIELYAMYVRSTEIGQGAGRRLVLQTLAHARRVGASTLVWFVHAGNTFVRDRLERRGLTPHAGPLGRQWYGHAVEVYEYRLNLRT
ncbi:MAG TPA: GNAT family N-acetyltransferase [Acidimicrobiia bacterium]|nr:GNAT family N-acetyltransferase [Acidimicrobiia bacterium]